MYYSTLKQQNAILEFVVQRLEHAKITSTLDKQGGGVVVERCLVRPSR